MKRALTIMALLAVAAVSGAVVYESAGREQEYRALLARGDAALAGGQTFAAIEDYSGAIALRPDAMLARLRRGETYRQRGDLEAAAKDFRAAADLDPSATRPLDEWGDALYRLQRYARAAEVYEERLRLDDRSAPTRYKSALARYRAGDMNAALAALDLAIKLDDHLADAHYLMGLCLRELGRTQEAAAALERAVVRAPGLVEAREELAEIYGALGRRTDELRHLQFLAGLEVHRVERRIAVGLAHAKAGQADLAVLALAGAAADAPDQSAVYAALGRVWLDIAETQPEREDARGKALEALARAASFASATSEVKTLYGRALRRGQQLEAAEQVFQQATERYPVDPAAFAEYAALAEHHRHYDAARAALISYHALARDDGGLAARAMKIGQLSLRVNDPRAAVLWMQRAVAAAPGDPRAQASLLEAQRALSRQNQ
jgi:tetratricopeptide (TPR) repeat protein